MSAPFDDNWSRRLWPGENLAIRIRHVVVTAALVLLPACSSEAGPDRPATATVTSSVAPNSEAALHATLDRMYVNLFRLQNWSHALGLLQPSLPRGDQPAGIDRAHAGRERRSGLLGRANLSDFGERGFGQGGHEVPRRQGEVAAVHLDLHQRGLATRQLLVGG